VGAYKQAQTELWNAAGAATQHEHTELLRTLYDHIVTTVSRQSRGGHHAVLDIASGPGEPAISIARALPSCSVLATDMACNMVQTARIRAKTAGLSNFRCKLLLSC
jgi:ubiquinone/menaquinone biosynthesis C-methylase UbiE